jgi:hypothetical protein
VFCSLCIGSLFLDILCASRRVFISPSIHARFALDATPPLYQLPLIQLFVSLLANHPPLRTTSSSRSFSLSLCMLTVSGSYVAAGSSVVLLSSSLTPPNYPHHPHSRRSVSCFSTILLKILLILLLAFRRQGSVWCCWCHRRWRCTHRRCGIRQAQVGKVPGGGAHMHAHREKQCDKSSKDSGIEPCSHSCSRSLHSLSRHSRHRIHHCQFISMSNPQG